MFTWRVNHIWLSNADAYPYSGQLQWHLLIPDNYNDIALLQPITMTFPYSDQLQWHLLILDNYNDISLLRTILQWHILILDNYTDVSLPRTITVTSPYYRHCSSPYWFGLIWLFPVTSILVLPVLTIFHYYTYTYLFTILFSFQDFAIFIFHRNEDNWMKVFSNGFQICKSNTVTPKYSIRIRFLPLHVNYDLQTCCWRLLKFWIEYTYRYKVWLIWY